jgi:hypothetical protein
MGDPYAKLYGEAHGGQETDPYGPMYVAPAEMPATTEYAKAHPIREAPFDPSLKDPGGVASFGMNLQNTLTLGQAKRIDAALTATIPKEGTTYGERYRKLIRSKEDELRAAHQFHPGLSFAGGAVGGAPYYAALPETAMGQIGGSAAIGGAQALGDSPNFAGSQGTNVQAVGDTAKGAAWGGAGGALGRYLEVAAPERAGKMADHFALRGSGGNTPLRMEKLRGAFPTEAPAGDLADVLYGEGILKPWQSGEAVAKSYGATMDRLGQKLGGLRQAAADSGHQIRISDVETMLQEEAGHLFPYNAQALKMRDNVIETLKMHAYGHKVGRPFNEVADLVRAGDQRTIGDLANMKTPFESVTLPELQETLTGTGIQRGASEAYAATRGNATHSPTEQEGNYMAIHRGLRRTEDKNLAESGVAGPEGARDLRRTMAAVGLGERVAGKAASQEHGKDPLGLYGWLMLGGAEAGGHHAAGLSLATATALARRFYGNELNTTAGWAANKLQHGLDSDAGRFLLRATPSYTAPTLGPKVWEQLNAPGGPQPLPQAAQDTVNKIDAAKAKAAMELEAQRIKAQREAVESNTGDDEELLNAP